jgi:hypothetical protein
VSAHDYITREGEYGPERAHESGGLDDDGASSSHEQRDPAIFTESGNLPAWAESDARAFWDAADLYERANGRLYISADFALPADFTEDEWVELARAFVRDLTADEQLPYTLAIHPGLEQDGHAHNPHAHVMISERQNDGVARSREQWFRRADPTGPARGGAPKSRTFHGRAWVEEARLAGRIVSTPLSSARVSPSAWTIAATSGKVSTATPACTSVLPPPIECNGAKRPSG